MTAECVYHAMHACVVWYGRWPRDDDQRGTALVQIRHMYTDICRVGSNIAQNHFSTIKGKSCMLSIISTFHTQKYINSLINIDKLGVRLNIITCVWYNVLLNRLHLHRLNLNIVIHLNHSLAHIVHDLFDLVSHNAKTCFLDLSVYV